VNAAVRVGFLGSVRPEDVTVTYIGHDGNPIGSCPTITDLQDNSPTPSLTGAIETGTRIRVDISSTFDTIIPGLLPYENMQLASESSRTIIRSVSVGSTLTPAPTATPIPTNTPTPTLTNTPTATFTPSNTPTITLTPALSYTPSNTFTPTHTPTNTPTFTPTFTPTSTPTNTPQCSINANNLVQDRGTGNSFFTLTFTLNQPPAEYYLSTLSISTTSTAGISKIIMNDFEHTTSGFNYEANKTLNLFSRYISLKNGINTLYIEYDKNIGKTGHTTAVNLTVWTPAGLTPGCEQVSWQLQP
jgi:hypothetical protein